MFRIVYHIYIFHLVLLSKGGNIMCIAKRIKECRKNKGLTQKELSNLLNVSPMTVRRWEWDERKPNIDIMPTLAKILDTSVEYLMGLQDNHKTSETNTQEISLLKLAEKINDENIVLKAPITVGMSDKMIIIEDWDTRQTICLPNNEEGRKAFTDFMNCSFTQKTQATQHVESTIQGNNNSNNNIGIVNERNLS